MSATLKLVPWDKALLQMSKAGQRLLASALSSINFKGKPKPDLFEATFDFGDTIAKTGQFCWGAIQNSPILEAARKELQYAPIPLGLVIEKTVEVSASHFDAAIPVTLIRPGELFGVFETLDYLSRNMPGDRQLKGQTWNVTAGAHSVIINYPQGKLGGNKGTPHWHLAVNHIKRAKIVWKCKVLFFPDRVITLKDGDSAFSDYLFKFGWRQNQIVLKYNAIFDNELDKIAAQCQRHPLGHSLFWVFIRLHLIANNIRPGYSLVTETASDDCGPFPSILKYLEANSPRPRQTTHGGWSPMLLEPCFLEHSPGIVFSSIYQPTIVGKIQVGREIDRELLKPIEIIREGLHNKPGYEWLSQANFALIKLKTRESSHRVIEGKEILSKRGEPIKKSDHLSQYKYEIRGHSELSLADIGLSKIENAYDETFSKILIGIRKH